MSLPVNLGRSSVGPFFVPTAFFLKTRRRLLPWTGPVRDCTVSFMDGRGLRHATTVYAGSVLEAAALGLRQLRDTGMLDDDAALELTVELVTRTAHQVPMNKLRMWLNSAGKDPRKRL